MGLEKKDINHGELVGKTVSLEFLAYACSDSGNGKRHVVHSLNLRSLKIKQPSRFSFLLFIFLSGAISPDTRNKVNLEKIRLGSAEQCAR